MNTKIACRNIRHLLYLAEDEINPQDNLAISKHLEFCSSCRKTREDFLLTRRKTLHLIENIPVYPDFTVSTEILIKSGSLSSGLRPAILLNPYWQKTLSIIRYASGIAAVFLLFLFISEQTDSVSKISMLENRIQSTVNPPSPGLIDRMTLARGLFTKTEWTDLAQRLNVKQIITDRTDLLRIKNALEKRIRSKKTGDLVFMTSFRNSVTIKRNAITFNNLLK